MVSLNREDVMMAVKRFGHPDTRDSNQQSTGRVETQEKKHSVAKRPVGGVPVLLNLTTKPTPAPRSHLRLPPIQVPKQASVDSDNDSDDYETISDDEYISMTPVYAGVRRSSEQVTKSLQPVMHRKSSAPERLHYSANTTPVFDEPVYVQCEPKNPRRTFKVKGRSISEVSNQHMHTKGLLGSFTSLDRPLTPKSLFSQETVRVSAHPRPALTNLVSGLSASVPNLLSTLNTDFHNSTPMSSPAQSLRSTPTPAYSSDDLYLEVQDALSLDSPLLHRVSTTFHTHTEDGASSSSECGSSLGSTGDLSANQPHSRKKVHNNMYLCM